MDKSCIGFIRDRYIQHYSIIKPSYNSLVTTVRLLNSITLLDLDINKLFLVLYQNYILTHIHL